MADFHLVVIRTFTDRVEADLAQSALQAAGIESMVRGDDCEGLWPGLSMSNGVELVVRAADAEQAAEILTNAAQPR